MLKRCSRKNKKNIVNFSYAEFTQRVVKDKLFLEVAVTEAPSSM